MMGMEKGETNKRQDDVHNLELAKHTKKEGKGKHTGRKRNKMSRG